MAGWTYTGVATAIASRRSVDDGVKVADFPAVAAGNDPAWQDFAHKVGCDFAVLAQQKNWGSTKLLTVSANNGAGDVLGVGVLTITLTIA